MIIDNSKFKAVSETGLLTISLLASAGVEEAMMFAEKIGLRDVRKDFNVTEESKAVLPQAIMQEARYRFLNRVVKENGNMNVIDFASGFSPRGYMLAKEGYNYVGLELEPTVSIMNDFVKSLGADELTGKVSYIECLSTDIEKLEETVKSMNGPVTIICEGFLMYLTNEQINKLLSGIHGILEKYGGSFITADMNFPKVYIGTHAALYGYEEGMKILTGVIEKTAEKAQQQFNKDFFTENGEAETRKMVEGFGVAVKDIPYYKSEENYTIFEKMLPEDIEKIKAFLSSCIGWSMK